MQSAQCKQSTVSRQLTFKFHNVTAVNHAPTSHCASKQASANQPIRLIASSLQYPWVMDYRQHVLCMHVCMHIGGRQNANEQRPHRHPSIHPSSGKVSWDWKSKKAAAVLYACTLASAVVVGLLRGELQLASIKRQAFRNVASVCDIDTRLRRNGQVY
jgi:hypothetical protein